MTALRHWLRWSWACLLIATGALWSVKRCLKAHRAVIVLALHRVLDDADYQRTSSLKGMLLRRRTFEKLVAYAAGRFEIVDLLEAPPAKESRRLRCAFTFDDGWSDNYSIVLPIAHAYGIPVTIFLCPGLIGLNKPFWPEQIAARLKAARPAAREREIERFIERLKNCTPDVREEFTATFVATDARCPNDDWHDGTLSWTDILEMDASGVRFGAHTQTHQVLTSLPEGQARRELLESKAALERTLKKPCRLFAYPNGNYSDQTRKLLAEAGISLAFTTRRGVWTAASDPLAIPRLVVDETDFSSPLGWFSPAMFEYTVFWKNWRAMCADGGSN